MTYGGLVEALDPAEVVMLLRSSDTNERELGRTKLRQELKRTEPWLYEDMREHQQLRTLEGKQRAKDILHDFEREFILDHESAADTAVQESNKLYNKPVRTDIAPKPTRFYNNIDDLLADLHPEIEHIIKPREPINTYTPPAPKLLARQKEKHEFNALRKLYTEKKSALGTRVRRFAQAAVLALSLTPNMSFKEVTYAAPVVEVAPVVVTPTPIDAQKDLSEHGLWKTYSAAGALKLVNSFVGKRDLPGHAYHKGTDFKAPAGTPVLAKMDGVISAIDRTPGQAGLQLDIENTDIHYRARHMYTHIRWNAGDSVHVGDTLGVVSSRSGFRPHLHEEVYAQVGGRFGHAAGIPLRADCLYGADVRQEFVKNMLSIKVPTGARYLPGKTLQEKMDRVCNEQTALLGGTYKAVYASF